MSETFSPRQIGNFAGTAVGLIVGAVAGGGVGAVPGAVAGGALGGEIGNLIGGELAKGGGTPGTLIAPDGWSGDGATVALGGAQLLWQGGKVVSIRYRRAGRLVERKLA